MEQLSKGSSICNSEVNEDLVQIQKYCEGFILSLKHHTQITEARFQSIVTCSATGMSEEDDSTLVSLNSIDIAPINRDIVKQVGGSSREGNRHMTSGVGYNRPLISCQSKQQATSGAEKSPSRVHLTSDKRHLLIACISNNTPTVCNMDRGKEVILLKNKGKSRQQR